jgi:hypothetical protein
MGGQALSHPSLFQHGVFHIIINGILRSRKTYAKVHEFVPEEKRFLVFDFLLPIIPS